MLRTITLTHDVTSKDGGKTARNDDAILQGKHYRYDTYCAIKLPQPLYYLYNPSFDIKTIITCRHVQASTCGIFRMFKTYKHVAVSVHLMFNELYKTLFQKHRKNSGFSGSFVESPRH